MTRNFLPDLALVLILWQIGFTAKITRLPKYLKTCKYNVPASEIGNCIGNAMEDALRTLKNGEPLLEIQPLDPLHVPKLDILQGNSPVSLSIRHRNLTIFGVSKCKIVHNEFDKADGTINGTMFCPKLKLDGSYELSGKVLLLPVRGKGRSVIVLVWAEGQRHEQDGTISDPLIDKNKCDFTAHGEQFTKDGSLYEKYSRIDFTITPQKMTMEFENLFGGDKILSNQINRFINENWREILKEMKPSYEAVFSYVFKDTVEKVFNKVPVKNILTDFDETAVDNL